MDPSQITASAQCPIVSILGGGLGPHVWPAAGRFFLLLLRSCVPGRSRGPWCAFEEPCARPIRGRRAHWESDRAAQEPHSPSLGLAPGVGGGLTREFRHHSPGLPTGAFRAQGLSAATLSHAPCKPLCGTRGGKSHLTMSPSRQKRKPSMDEEGRAHGVGVRRRAVERKGLLEGKGLSGEHQRGSPSRWP